MLSSRNSEPKKTREKGSPTFILFMTLLRVHNSNHYVSVCLYRNTSCSVMHVWKYDRIIRHSARFTWTSVTRVIISLRFVHCHFFECRGACHVNVLIYRAFRVLRFIRLGTNDGFSRAQHRRIRTPKKQQRKSSVFRRNSTSKHTYWQRVCVYV